MGRAMLKSLMARKLRLALTALAITLGVAFVAGTFVLSDTLRHAFDVLFEDVTEGIDVTVQGKSSFFGEGEPIPDDLLEELRAIDGVARAEGSVEGYAQLVDKKGEAISPQGPPTLGVSWSDAEVMSPLDLRAGEPPRGRGQVLIDVASARKYGFDVGDEITILFQGPSEEFTVVGTTGFGRADNLGGATLAAFDLETAQRLFDLEGKLTAINLVAEDGVTAGELRERIAEALPEDYEALTGNALAKQNADAVKEELSFITRFLLIFGGISLFVGSFIIFNTFTITIAQRTHELALIRTLGATSAQVLRSVVAEAAVVGLVASAVGIVAGTIGAIALQRLMGALGFSLPSSGTQLLPRTVIVSMAVGVFVTLASATVPARRAARVSPMAALRDASPAGAAKLSLLRAAAGALATLGGCGLMAGGLLRATSSSPVLVGAGAAVVLVGTAVLSPLIVRPLARLVGWPVTKLRDIRGRLATDNALRNPTRTASTAAALMIGLAMVALAAIFAASIKATAAEVIDNTFRADFIVTTSQFVDFSSEVRGRLDELPELDAAGALRIGEFRHDGSRRSVTATEPAILPRVLNMELLSGSLRGLDEDGVVVRESVAQAEGLAVGDTFDMEFARSGKQEFTVEGIHEDNVLIGSYVISTDAYENNFRERLDSVVLLRRAAGTPAPEARAAVERVLADFPNLELRDQVEFKEQQAGQIDKLLDLIYGLLGLSVIIALIGIVNTLALSVFERTRELGLLRAVGMTRPQVRSMIRWESLIIAVLGTVLGIAIGLLFAVAMISTLEDLTELVLPVSQLAIFVAAAAAAGLLAGILPARRAARVDVLRAITVE